MEIEDPERRAEERDYQYFCLRKCIEEESKNPRKLSEPLEEAVLKLRLNPDRVVCPNLFPLKERLSVPIIFWN